MKINDIKIKIIGGNGSIAGAHATVSLLNKLALELNLENDSDFPTVDFSNNPRYNIDAFGKMTDNVLLFFNHKMYDFVLVACNSVGKFIPKNDKFINLSNYVPKNSKVICSRFSRDNKIFGNSVFYSNEEEQSIVDKIISDAIKGRKTDLSMFTDKVIACTELSYCNDIGIEDTLDYAIDVLVKRINKVCYLKK